MDYDRIPEDTRRYICRYTYDNMTKCEKVVYYYGARNILNDMIMISPMCNRETDTRTTSLVPSEISQKITPAVSSRVISFVGMRFLGYHIFSSQDVVILEREYHDPDGLRVKVLLSQYNKWVHVAYVSSQDVIWLENIREFERGYIKFVENFSDFSRFVYELP